MTEVLPSVLVLAVIAIVALWLTISRGGVAASAAAVQRAVWIAVVAVVAQAGHFAEELATGLHERLPAVFGLPPMSLRLFVAVNLAWLGIWALSVWGLARRLQAALFPLWFLGIAGVANGLLHPLLALNAGGYFPGLATSLLMAAIGVLLLAQLARVTT
ncbi:MAG: hypothetical protein GY788_26590 [bacterium]|nr:hypothetical protein [bacterium]